LSLYPDVLRRLQDSPVELTRCKGCTGLICHAIVAKIMAVERNFRNWQAFSRIFEMMTFVDRIQELTPEEREETAYRLCELPANPEHTMSLEEVVFWAGVATGMDVFRSTQEELLDDHCADRIQAYSSLLAYSTKSAVVDLTLEQLEPSK